jgi:hypothetical protein
LNHNIIFAIFYYEPVQKNIPKLSILNPEYKMNYLDYLYKQEEIEGDSDSGDEGDGGDGGDGKDDKDGNEDFSRDDIDDYKIKENLYSKREQPNNYYQNNGIIEDASEADDETSEADDTGITATYGDDEYV